MEEASTEQKIKEAARKVFTQKGMAGARMQEIADEAGINKALLHYYYRSKEQLFDSIFEEIVRDLLPALFAVLNDDLPLEVKVYQISDRYVTFLSDHKELPLFILNELQRHPERLIRKIQIRSLDFSVLARQLKEEAEQGRIRPVSIETFLMNMISMLIFPFVAKPMAQAVTGMDDAQYELFLENRKTEVPKFIMNALRT